MKPRARLTGVAILVSCGLGAGLTAGCMGAQAKAIVVPTLDMPAPPPRVVETNTPAAPPPVSLPEEPVRNTPPPPRPAPPAPRAAESAPKTEAPEPVRPADDASRTPAGALQTGTTKQEAEVERRIRTELAQATSDLNRIAYQQLDADARVQYDTARRFIGQAEEAVRARNLVFATNLAQKAAMLAAQLAGR